MRWARVLVMALALPGATRGGGQDIRDEEAKTANARSAISGPSTCSN